MRPLPSEDLIHYVWQTKNFNFSLLKTTEGDSIKILSWGHHNHNAGPDFLNASIIINHVTWVGHLEMHVLSSDWIKHAHDKDPAYENVILHVVWERDVDIFTSDGSPIPCLALSDRIPDYVLSKYHMLRMSHHWIPCEPFIKSIDSLTRASLIDRLLAERLDQKALDILGINKQNNSDFGETIYQILAKAFGLSVNAEAFLSLARRTPFIILSKHRDSLFQLEALLLGQSGLLTDSTIDHPYILDLKKEYGFLAIKYSLTPMNPVAWRFMRMRPSGFPTIRIAQFALFLFQNSRLDEFIVNSTIPQINNAFDHIILDGFWNYHYTLKESSVYRKKTLGKDKKHSLVINAVVPLIYAYGVYKNSQSHKENAVAVLENIKAEKNSILDHWTELGFVLENSADSQALLQLKKHYCDQYRCLSCQIGHKILNKE